MNDVKLDDGGGKVIKLQETTLHPSVYKDFTRLCDGIYDFVRDNEVATCFQISMKFSPKTYPELKYALAILTSNGCLKNGFKGYEPGNVPIFIDLTDEEDQSEFEPISEQNDEDRLNDLLKYQMRIDFVRESELKMRNVLENISFHHPCDTAETDIASVGKVSERRVLTNYFIKESEIKELVKINANAENIIDEFINGFSFIPGDVGIYNTFDVPSNVFVYVFNRSELYLSILQHKYAPGFESIIMHLFPSDFLEKLDVSDNSDDCKRVEIEERTMAILSEYLRRYGTDERTFVSAILSLMNDVPVRKRNVKEVYERHFHRFFNEDKLNLVFSNFIEYDDKVKFLRSENLQGVTSVLQSVEEIEYGVSVEKLYRNCEQRLNINHIDNAAELADFIEKYTKYTVSEGRVLSGKTINDSLLNFINDTGIYDFQRLLRVYPRRCGGMPKDMLEFIFRSLNLETIPNKFPMADYEREVVSAKLDEFQWITVPNAESIFADLHGIENKFTDQNMHTLGFNRINDAFYRVEYQSFADCLRENYFNREEIDAGSRDFQIKKECKAFANELEAFERSLKWIPVSKSRLINLDSPRFCKLSKILEAYRKKVVDLCKEGFVTPYLLENTTVGIPEIDDDDFGKEFYDAILLASGAGHQTLAKQRFYFIPSDFTSYTPTVPGFVRYILEENGGYASISEIQAILEEKYGIKASKPIVRNSVKNSYCIFSEVNDTAYIDDESLVEAIRYE